MPARRLAGVLGLLAAVTVLVAAFLPRVVVPRAGFEFRDVDLELRAVKWVPALIFALVQTLLYAVPSIGLLLDRRSYLAMGILLGIGTYGLVGSAVYLLTPDRHFNPGIAQWLFLTASMLGVAAAGLALSSRERDDRGAGDPPPPGDWATGS